MNFPAFARLLALDVKSRWVALLCLSFWSVAGTTFAAPAFIGWIPVQTIPSTSPTEFDLSRWLDPGAKGNVELVRPEPLEKTEVTLDAARLRLRVHPSPETCGLENLILRVVPAEGPALEGVLTLAIQTSPTAQFRFYGTGSEKSVCVAGLFNSWNASATPLKKTTPNLWELSLPLPLGSHPYKLVVDGQWRLDPANPEKTSDGGGPQNSVCKVTPAKGPAPVLLAASRSPGELTFAVHPVSWEAKSFSSIVEFPDGTSKQIPVEPAGEGKWKVKTATLPEAAWIRFMAIDAKGTPAFPARARAGSDPAPGTDRHDHIIYFAFIDRLIDGDPSNNPKPDPKVEPQAQYYGGDLAGVRRLIEEGYFEKLGVNTLWLSPVNQNPLASFQEYKEPRRWYTGYHGYWPDSSTEVEKRFGGNEALTALVQSARPRGLHILLDLVLAHVHQDHPIFKEHPDWFGSLTLPDGTRNLRKWDNETQFTTWFEPFLPRFNYDNPQASSFLIENAVDWVKRFDLDGFRLDAVKHIPPNFWTSFREGLREKLPAAQKDSFYLVGETFMDRSGINSFIGPNRLDGQFEFPLYDSILATFGMGTGNFADLEASAASSDRVFGPETTMSPLLGNHDKSRFLAYADGDLPDPKEADEAVVGWTKPPKVDHPSSYAKLRLAFTFVLTSPGVPTIYYGDEVGMTGAQDPDNRRMFPDLTKLSKEEQKVQEHVSKLNAFRTAHPAIRYGSRRAIVTDKDTYAVVRAYPGDRVLIVYNRSDKSRKLELEVSPELSDGSLIDSLGIVQKAEVKNGKLSIELPPFSSSLLIPE